MATDEILAAPAAIAAELLGRRPQRIEAFRPPSGGLESDCFRLWSGGDALFMKLNTRPEDPLGICFHRRLAEAGLPVPALVAWDPAVGEQGRPCAIWEYADGDQADWGATRGCPYDEAHCGELLRAVHELEYDGPFCFVGDDGPAPEFGPCVETWAEMFPCAWAAKEYFDMGRFDRRQADLLAALPEKLAAELGAAPKRLLHMDFMYNGNLVVAKGGKRIIGIVDGAEAMAGDPRLELGYFDHGDPRDRERFDMARFRAGYGAAHDPKDDLGRFYALCYYLFERFNYGYVRGDRGKDHQEEIKALLQTFA